MIDELEIKRYDKMFGTKSRIFQPDIILITSSFDDDWSIRITNKKNKGICLLHRNKYGKKNKYHTQSWKTQLYHVYDSIYKHKNSCLYKINIEK